MNENKLIEPAKDELHITIPICSRTEKSIPKLASIGNFLKY